MRKLAHRRWPAAFGLALLHAVAACGGPQKPPVRFAESAAFDAIDQDAFGILEEDVNLDGLPDAVVVRKVGPGYAATLFVQKKVEKGDAWDEVCTGPVVRGGELATLRWVTPGSGKLLLMTVTSENPDEAVERMALIDTLEDCALRLEETVQIIRPNGLPIAPDGLSGGVLVDGDGELAIVDQPKYFTLQGSEGEAAILTRVRMRRILGHRREVRVEESTHELMRTTPLRVSWVAPDSEPRVLDVLGDGDDRTSFVARADEAGELLLEADKAIVAIEIRHGCYGQQESILQLAHGEAPPVTLGSLPPEGSFAIAIGRTPAQVDGVRRDLLAPRVRQKRWTLRLGPAGAERCLRELQGFAFSLASDAATGD